MKIDVLDKNANKVEDLTLSKEVFGCDVNESLLTQYVHVYRTNQRQGTVATKTRGLVSGGGKKPWRQKGTGRARHGSIRSPIWVGGGVAHGPQQRNWRLSLPKKMKQAAMKSILSLKLSQKSIIVVDELSTKNPSTKYIVNLLNKLGLSGKTLIVLDKGDKNILMSTSNVMDVSVAEVQNVNVFEIFGAKNILFTKEGIKALEEKNK